MILTVTLNPSVDHALFVDELRINDTNRVRRTERDAGGKGINAARVAAELGAEVFATGFLGGGPGAYVRSVLDQQGVQHDFVEVPGETRVNFSVEDGSGLPPTTFNEPGPTIPSESFEELRSRIRGMAKRASWVCFGGSLPPGVRRDAFKVLIEDCQSEPCRIALDADGEALAYGLQACPDFVKPNVREASRLVGRDLRTHDDLMEGVQHCLRRLRRRGPMVILSRGAEGALLSTPDQTFVGISPEVQVRSTVGSGDSLVAGFLWALEAGKPLEEAFRWGLAAGAATATTDGSEIGRRSVIERLFPFATVEQAVATRA